MEKELDEKTKAILEVLRRYPDGISVNKLYEKLKDDKGRYLMSKPTFQKRLEMLKSKGLIIVEGEKEWEKGKKKILKLKDSSRILAEKIFEVKIYREVFKKYLETNKSKFKELENFYMISTAKNWILRKLNEIRTGVLSSEMSDNLKREIIIESYEVEKDINLMLVDIVIEIAPFLFEVYKRLKPYLDLNHYSNHFEIIKPEDLKELKKTFEMVFENKEELKAKKLSLAKYINEIISFFSGFTFASAFTSIKELKKVESELEKIKKEIIKKKK